MGLDAGVAKIFGQCVFKIEKGIMHEHPDQPNGFTLGLDLFVYALGLLPERANHGGSLGPDQPEPMFWLTDVAQGLAMEDQLPV